MQPGGRSDLHFDINSVCKLDEKIQTLSFILAFSLVALQRLLGGILLLKVFLSHMIMITTDAIQWIKVELLNEKL